MLPPSFSTFSIAFLDEKETSIFIAEVNSPTFNNFKEPLDLFKILFSKK